MYFLLRFFLLFPAFLSASTLQLSVEEQHYLAMHPTIRVHNETNWAPFNFNENNQPKGFSVELMNLIAQKVGFHVAYITGYTWNDFLTMIQNNELDVMLNIVQNEERDKYLLFTEPYQAVAHCIVTRSDSPYKFNSVHDILDKRIAIENGYFNHHYLSTHYPATSLILKKDTLSVLQSVSYGEADLTIGLLPVETYMIKHYGLNNLKVIGISDEDLFSPKELRMATSIHNPILHNILQKGLDALTPEEKNNIADRWIDADIEKMINWDAVIKLALIFFIILAGTLFWLWRIKQVQNQLAESNALMHNLLNTIPSPIFYKDAKGVFLGFNQAYERAFGVDSRQLIGKTVLDLEYLPLEDRLMYHEEDVRVIQGTLALEREQEMAYADGMIHHTLYCVNGFQTFNGKPGGLIGIFTDITEQKRIQKELEHSKQEVALSHKAMKDSIEYASLIQHSLLPPHGILRRYFSDSCVIWHPKAIVGGDIYFIEEFADSSQLLMMMMDCTGHGVPGAFVTMLVKAIERQIIATIRHKEEAISPAKILGLFNKSIKHLLNQNDEKSLNNAGFDGAILLYDKKTARLTFAGAQLPLFYIQEDGSVEILKGDRHSIGYKQSKADYVFTEHSLDVRQGGVFYVCSDGYWDQNGGEKGFPFGKGRFIDLIKTYHNASFSDQQEIFLDTLQAYQGQEERNDDIMLIGFKI